MGRKLHTIEETRAEAGSLGGAGHERMDQLVTPTSPEEARGRFDCTVYSCSLSGGDCARRSIKARTGDSAPGGMLACRVCPAGAARARLLDPDYVPDPMDGRRPGYGKRPAKRAKQPEPQPGPVQVRELPLMPPCGACGAPRTSSRRGAKDPLRPFCYACVTKARSRLRKHTGSAPPLEAIAASLNGKPPAAALKAAGITLEPKTPPCAACGAPRLFSRRPEGHPLRPYCRSCARGTIPGPAPAPEPATEPATASAAGGEGPPEPAPPAAPVIRVPSRGPDPAAPLPSDVRPPASASSWAVEGRRLLRELEADREADRAEIKALRRENRHLIIALAARSGLVVAVEDEGIDG